MIHNTWVGGLQEFALLTSSMEGSVLETWVPGAGAGAIFFYFFNSFVIQAKLGFPLQQLCALP